jgi:hypothetical protein
MCIYFQYNGLSEKIKILTCTLHLLNVIPVNGYWALDDGDVQFLLRHKW